MLREALCIYEYIMSTDLMKIMKSERMRETKSRKCTVSFYSRTAGKGWDEDKEQLGM